MYSDFYGFSDRPFQLTPDARFYFGSRTHKKAMAYLGYGLAQGEGFIVITGDIGAGKSTLVAHLMATVDRSRLNAINIVSTQVEGDDMLRLAAQGMGLFTEGVTKAQLLERVERHLDDEARHGKRTLLIVDEAQNLSVSALEELRMLSNFQVSGQALLQIFLLGQPEFREKLASESLEQLRQRVIATHHLEPMEPNEVEPYIVHRLKTVGWEGNPVIEIPAFAEIYRHTGGVPRKVNQFAGRLMLHAAVEELDTIDAETVVAVAEDLEEDAPRPTIEQRGIKPTYEPVRDLALERRVAMLEAQLEEQERATRRVLTLLVDWVESEEDAVIHHAA
ncbi:MAG TPA: XrtA/PEP-CTERM system-associated ATPase [Allosphingosinicella sp.]|jgi:putative secretion ATPase (PEP-CTERM system associated)|uniref:XrtA/PEP-CTERM system-associated ATPase n=1 Tax=Allosphingosinicella sp. TaxID=2823234 RepID=UPI002F2A655E